MQPGGRNQTHDSNKGRVSFPLVGTVMEQRHITRKTCERSSLTARRDSCRIRWGGHSIEDRGKMNGARYPETYERQHWEAQARELYPTLDDREIAFVGRWLWEDRTQGGTGNPSGRRKLIGFLTALILVSTAVRIGV